MWLRSSSCAALSIPLFRFLFLFSIVESTFTDAPSIEIRNYKFYDSSTKEYFPVKGIAYYPRPNDGTNNANNVDLYHSTYSDVWSRDIPFLAATGANAIRLYAVDPSKNHDAFMCSLASAGLYVIIDLQATCVGCHISPEDAPACYPGSLKTRGQQIINAFAKYSNVLAFSAGNEVNHVATNEYGNAPCQKRFLRDMRKYIAECTHFTRRIPVGVVLADSGGERVNNAQYYNCQPTDDQYEQAEWYGLNAYLYCDATVTDPKQMMGWQGLKNDVKSLDYSIPFLLTEFGCLNPSFPTIDGYEAQRTFTNVPALYSSEYKDQIAGGFVFEYSTEKSNSETTSPYPFTKYGPQNYGLGYFSPADCDDIDIPCEYHPMPNYYNLTYKAISMTDEPGKDEFVPETARTAPSTCPSADWVKPLSEYVWEADETEDLSCSTGIRYMCSTEDLVLADGRMIDTPAITSDTPSTTEPTTDKSDKSDASAAMMLPYVVVVLTFGMMAMII